MSEADRIISELSTHGATYPGPAWPVGELWVVTVHCEGTEDPRSRHQLDHPRHSREDLAVFLGGPDGAWETAAGRVWHPSSMDQLTGGADMITLHGNRVAPGPEWSPARRWTFTVPPCPVCESKNDWRAETLLPALALICQRRGAPDQPWAWWDRVRLADVSVRALSAVIRDRRRAVSR